VGVPGDPADIGNWGDWVGTLALIIEAGLITVSSGMLWAMASAVTTANLKDPHD
jgi:hypothetical protein